MIRVGGVIPPVRLWVKAGQPAGEPGSMSVERGAVVAQVHGVHGQFLFGFARRLGLTDDQADDAVQEVLARLLAALQGESMIASPRGWAFRSIYRLAMDEHRLRRRLTVLTAALSRPASREPGDDTTRIAVWAEVDRLPFRQRQVLYLRYRVDLPFDEIATTLGITSGGARSHATQALARLRDRLAGSIEDLD